MSDQGFTIHEIKKMELQKQYYGDLKCVVCLGEIGEGHSECEECHQFYCAEHTDLVSLYKGDALCPVCKALKQLADIQIQITDINKTLCKALGREVA